ncbi:MAG TPA: PKD domain-containing protein, partial [Bacteroidia bacterium]|nr:PKD domain-containing protein [Bacteroidia bacterium]
ATIGCSTINSCKKEESASKPTVDFIYTGGGCTAPCAVLFENKSKDAATFLWDFGDGTTSTASNPTKTYNAGGTYTVSLTATGEGGSASVSKQILIQNSTQSQLPTANFTFTGGGCMAPCNVNFTNTSANATTYTWDFGDGTSSTSLSPSKIYSTGGSFSVILTATNAAGTNQITKIVNIASSPTKAKITKVTITNMPFVNSSGASWDFVNGPDVFFNITDQASNILSSSLSSKINDVTSAALPLAWTYTTAFEINDFNAGRYIDVWDYDTPDPDDYIGYVGFQMSHYTSGSNPYPTTVTKTQNGITVKLDLIWQ